MNETHNVTQILKQVEEGDPSAAEALLPLVYEDLRRLGICANSAAQQWAERREGYFEAS